MAILNYNQTSGAAGTDGLPMVAMVMMATSAVQAQSVRVTASRREVRAVFPRDTAHSWGWSAAEALPSMPTYSWAISVYGMDGTRMLELTAIARETRERHWNSLSALVASALAGECKPGMMSVCDTARMTASVCDGQVILVLRDSARIDRLFGLRPARVDTWVMGPGRSRMPGHDSVAVEYVDPQIPSPDAARRAAAARSQRRYEESIHLAYRSIDAGENDFAPIWLTVGDSVAVHVAETRCTFDACSGWRSSASDSGWQALDPTIARLRPTPPDTGTTASRYGWATDRTFVYGVRAGRTAIRVHGVHSPLDTAVSGRPPAHELERAIIVTPPIGRVRISPRPRRARVREILHLRVQVFDADGRSIAHAPAIVEIEDGGERYRRSADAPADIGFTHPGPARIIARVGAHADTLALRVVPIRTRAPR